MSQGNANRVSIGTGTSGSSDVFTATLPLDTRWDIVPGSIRVYQGVTGVRLSWGTQYLVARDDGAGNIVGDPGYPNVIGSIDYATGDIVVNENGSNAIVAGSDCWVEYYERFPTSPVDDFWVGYCCANYNQKPLVIHRAAHSAFGSRNLVNHGTYCMMARQEFGSHHGMFEVILKDPDFLTDRPIMSEIAIRSAQVEHCVLGPMLTQRVEDLNWGSTRRGYHFGPTNFSGASWYLQMTSGAGVQTGYRYVPQYEAGDAGAVYVQPLYSYPNNIRRRFVGNVDNTPPNILVDDWHKIRMITTMDAFPGDIHIQLLMALGNTEVDKAEPTFLTFADVWHQASSDTPVWTPPTGFPSGEDLTGSWGGHAPHAYPPTPGYQGFVVGAAGAPTLANTEVFFDDFRCYRMPEV